MSKEEELHNPAFVRAETCAAYRETLEEKIESIKSMVKLTGAVITIVLGVVQVVLTVWKG